MAGVWSFLRLWAVVLALLIPFPSHSQEIAIGDSIALGLKEAGHLRGGAVIGASPVAVYEMVLSYPYEWKNEVVILSCGLSNNILQIAYCEADIRYLTAAGAKVVVLGVGDGIPNNVGLNTELLEYANDHGAGFVYGWPGIHPPYNYVLSEIRNNECKWWKICPV